MVAFDNMSSKTLDEELDEQLIENFEALTNNEGEIVKCYCKKSDTDSTRYVCSSRGSISYCGADPCSNHDTNCR